MFEYGCVYRATYRVVGPALRVCICHIHHNYTIYRVLQFLRGGLPAEYPATSDHHCLNASFYKRIYQYNKRINQIYIVAGYSAVAPLWGQLCGSVYALYTIYKQ